MKVLLISAFAGAAFILNAQISRPATTTQTFRDSKGRVTGTATTTTTATGSKVTTYQTGGGTPVNSSTDFPKQGTATLVQKNVYPDKSPATPKEDLSKLTLPAEKKQPAEKQPAEKQATEKQPTVTKK